MDANGILNVSAKDSATSKEQKITITSSSGLSKEEVEKIARDAEANSAEDRARQEQVELRNRADAMIYSTENTLKEHREKIDEEEAKAIDDAIAETRKAVQDTDADAINVAMENLTKASHKLAEVMYKATSSTETGVDDPPSDEESTQDDKSKKDDVVDAEFVDVDDKQKS